MNSKEENTLFNYKDWRWNKFKGIFLLLPRIFEQAPQELTESIILNVIELFFRRWLIISNNCNFSCIYNCFILTQGFIVIEELILNSIKKNKNLVDTINLYTTLYINSTAQQRRRTKLVLEDDRTLCAILTNSAYDFHIIEIQFTILYKSFDFGPKAIDFIAHTEDSSDDLK